MNKSFGPWSTSISTGTRQELNTFWKRRLAMLPKLSQGAGRATWRAIIVLGILAIAALAFPLLKSETRLQTLVQVVDSSAVAAEPAEGVKPHERQPAEARARNAVPLIEYLPRPTKAEERVLEALAMPVDINFRELPLVDCLDFIKTYPNLPRFELHLDGATLADEGVTIDAPMTLKLKGCRLESALKLLLDPLQLTCVFENDVLLVTSSAKAGEKLITRTYPIRDLFQGRNRADGREHQGMGMFNVDDELVQDRDRIEGREQPQNAKAPQGGGFGHGGMKYDDLVEAILTTIQPDSWEELSGPGSLTYVKESGCLVIRQTLQVHREILQLLRDLREAKKMGQVPRDRGAS
jgi:hypothetical protein